eukprot:3937586-Rhodomonas_salina.2
MCTNSAGIPTPPGQSHRLVTDWSVTSACVKFLLHGLQCDHRAVMCVLTCRKTPVPRYAFGPSTAKLPFRAKSCQFPVQVHVY